jgi:asparagine synthetase B (glutamine-hydrolysing)
MNDTPPAFTDTIDALDHALQTATDRIRPDVLLLSGGLDSALLAAMWKRAGHRFRAITVGLDPNVPCVPAHRYLPYPCNSDITWARKVADHLHLDWTPVILSEREALDALDWLMTQQRSFDLGQLNNIPLIAGLQATTTSGGTFSTGDDGDGLFGGYLFSRDQPDWGAYVTERIPHIEPPARGIGAAAGWSALFPYLEPEVLDIARSLTNDNIRQRVPTAEHPLPPSFMDQFDRTIMEAQERPWGKMILRRVAERWLPREIAWRPKTDLQFGSGMCALEPVLSLRINSGLMLNLQTTGIHFYNDAHRALYLRFRGLGLTVPPVRDGDYACASCGGGVPVGKRHCSTCGHWPAGTG